MSTVPTNGSVDFLMLASVSGVDARTPYAFDNVVKQLWMYGGPSLPLSFGHLRGKTANDTVMTLNNSAAAGKTGPTSFNYAQTNTYGAGQYLALASGVQRLTLQTTGIYQITAAGARGGQGGDLGGGIVQVEGIVVRTNRYLTAGTTLNVIVGQAGGNTNAHGTGGGGGTFVYTGELGGATLILAAGGGGGHQYASSAVSRGVATTSAQSGFQLTTALPLTSGAGGTGGGSGGGGSPCNTNATNNPGGAGGSAGGGAGGQGANVTYHNNSGGGGGGQGWNDLNTTGGSPLGGNEPSLVVRVGAGAGGFGGGGAGGSGWSAPGTGGGGGYSGGGGSAGYQGQGGGGGSYDVGGILNAATQITTEGSPAGYNNGHGYVKLRNVVFEPRVLMSGLVAWIDPANAHSYSGSGASVFSLVGRPAPSTLRGTYSHSNGRIRLTNDSATHTSNASVLDMATYAGVRTVSLWYYQHSAAAERYLMDLRTGAADSWVYSSGAGAAIDSFMKNGGAAVAPVTWSGIETVGAWQNVTITTTVPMTDNATLFGANSFMGGLDVTFGDILMYDKVLTPAENAANFQAMSSKYGIS